MNPETHFLATWVLAAKTTDNPRDCRLVTLAGILPDADGLGLLLDVANQAFWGKRTFYYIHYHHYLLHGIFGAILVTALLTSFARRKGRVAVLSFLAFHLHLLCDLLGSRGPDPVDLWPLFYLGPFSKEPMWIWNGQWPLDAWPIRVITVILFAWSLWLAVRLGYSFVGVFSPRLDRVFVDVLRKWHQSLRAKFSPSVSSKP